MSRDLSTFDADELRSALLAQTGERTAEGCLLWAGHKRPKGYGVLSFRSNAFGAHRVACFLAHGAPDGKKDACHRCDNPSCIEPAHLFWGTRSENMLDASSKSRLPLQVPGAAPHGHKHPRARLTPEALEAIVLTDEPAPSIAARFNYDVDNIYTIRAGRLWKRQADELRARHSPSQSSEKET